MTPSGNYLKCIPSIGMITMSAADAGLFLNQSGHLFKFLTINVSIAIQIEQASQSHNKTN